MNRRDPIHREQIKKEFDKRKLMGGAGEDDPVARVVAQMTQFNDGLEAP